MGELNMVRFLLNIIVFVSGAVLMGLEIVGSRVLAPYFGSSIFVWGSLISVVMAALSIGYYWGGWLSAREPSYGRLLTLLLIPGILIFFLPFLYPTLNEWIAGVDFGTRLNPLIASSIYFLPPGIFLGTISPYVIRLAATALSTVGSTAGTLYAISTCGSIFGTLLTAFYLIPLMGVTNIIHSMGIILVCLFLLVVPLLRLRSVAVGRAVTVLSIIGSGGGSIPKKLQKEFPSLEIDVVEIDLEVIQIAKNHFNVRESNRLHLHAQDGRLFLTRTANQYDIILLDAYYADAMPFHLATREFFELAQRKLTPNGIVVANLISAVTGPSGKIARAFVKTERRVFPQTYVFAARRAENVSTDTIQNIIVVATKDKQRLEIKEIVKRSIALNKGLFPDPIQDIGVD